ncbi:MAG: acyl-CoA dehydrogenase, partial [Rhizobiales bacterium]|nr:acyl-CoA dehydrogenase [Hyphomicrobiales bacterium]
MVSYKAPVAETQFVLSHVLRIEDYASLPGFAEAGGDIIDAVLAEGSRIAEEVLLPLNQSGDREGCSIDGGKVTTPQGFKQAYGELAQGGWIGLTASPDNGGQGLPPVLGAALNEYLTSANMALAMYPGLSMGAYAALERHASEQLKAIYLPKLASGEWAGTMNLTEPQCGTDLGLIRSSAKKKAEDDSYLIKGTKIFISAGEHDLTDNIVHLVLARIEGAPEGTKGVSLFVVPKFLPDESGNAGARNGVECTALESKMGIHANATCVMQYEDAVGWLVGEEHRGLPAMFTMMNEARLGVGIQGLGLSEIAYQNAAAYAIERLQGRALTGPADPDKPADPLIVHPDVRRILMDIRSFNEAARALVLWTSLRASVAQAGDETEAQAAEDHLGLVTPVIKGLLTAMG